VARIVVIGGLADLKGYELLGILVVAVVGLFVDLHTF